MANSSILTQLILIVFLTAVNAFFAASEIAIVSVDPKKLKRQSEAGDTKALQLLELTEKPSKFLSTIQVGITFAGFFSSASAAVGISDVLGNTLSQLGVPFASKIAFIGVTLLLSYFVLIFGELVPKRIALQDANRFARLAVSPITWIAKIMNPFVILLSLSTNFIIRILGFKTDRVEANITLEEIKSLLEVGEEQGVIESIEKNMMTSIMTFDNKLADDIMTARPDVFMLEIQTPYTKAVDGLLNHPFSRIPVYQDNRDNIIGILYLRDLCAHALKNNNAPTSLAHLIRPPYRVPERININDLFIDMQAKRQHMALLIDQHGGFSGIVTLEDLLEEIVGQIDDEFDLNTPMIEAIDKNSFLASGKTSIKELNQVLHTNFDAFSESYDTLSGLLIHTVGHLPNSKKIDVIIDSYRYEAIDTSDQRIIKVKIHRSI